MKKVNQQKLKRFLADRIQALREQAAKPEPKENKKPDPDVLLNESGWDGW